MIQEVFGFKRLCLASRKSVFLAILGSAKMVCKLMPVPEDNQSEFRT